MALVIGDNFNYQGKSPNFERDSFNSLEELKNYPEYSLDEGHISFCRATKKYYKFNSDNTLDPILGKWRLIVDTTLDASSENPVQNKVVFNKFLEKEKEFYLSIGKETKKIYDILYDQHSELSLYSDIPDNIIEKGVNKKIVLYWNYKFNNKDQTPNKILLKSESDKILINDVNIKSVSDTINNSKLYTIVSNNIFTTTTTTLTINAYYPKYFGSSEKTTITGSDILNFNKQEISSTSSGEYNFNISNENYIWFCVPEEMNIYTVETPSGFNLPLLENPIRVPVENKGVYKCYRSIHKFKAEHFKCRIVGDNYIINNKLIELDQIELTFKSNLLNNVIEKDINTNVTLYWNCLVNGTNEQPDILELSSNNNILTTNIKQNSFSESINNNKSYKLLITNNNITRTEIITIESSYPKYYGGSNKTTLTEYDILGLEKQSISINAIGSFEFNVNNSEYAWFCIPENMEINKIVSDGFEVPIESFELVSTKNKGNYKCYRTSNKLVKCLFSGDII